VFVVTVLLVASVLLVALSFAWYRLSARTPALSLHHLATATGLLGGRDEEEQGLLTDVTGPAAAADSDMTTTGADERRSLPPACRPNRLVVASDSFTGVSNLLSLLVSQATYW